MSSQQPPPRPPHHQPQPRRTNTHKDLGRAPSTVKGDSVSVRFYNAYRAVRGRTLDFDNMVYAEIENENLESEIQELADYCSSNVIPARFTGTFLPPQPEAGDIEDQDQQVQILKMKTISQYIGNIITVLRVKFPHHDDFVGLKANESPKFWSRIRPQFEKACTRFHNAIGGDYVFGATTVRPLYSSNSYTETNSDYASIKDFVSKIDLAYILKALVGIATPGPQPDGPLQHRAIIAITFMAVGRGGEAKFLNTSNFMYHGRFQCPDIVWTELKNMKKYAMPMFPNKDDWKSDFYHSVGAFWAVEWGLHRPATRQDTESFLFPHLHSIKSDNVSKKITAIMRSVLPDDIPERLQREISSKSLRKGSVSQLLINHDLSIGEICSRTGHSTGTNLDSYADDRNVVRGIAAGKALAGWSNVRASVNVPSFECIRSDDPATAKDVDSFIERLFVVSLPDFQPGGHLYRVLETCAASLVMYHNQVTTELNADNVISSRLREVACLAKIGRHGMAAAVVLARWSDAIHADYHSKNPEIAETTPDMSGLTATINQLVVANKEASATMKQFITASQKRDLLYENQISYIHKQLAEKESQVDKLREQLTHARQESPTSRDSSPSSPRVTKKRTAAIPALDLVTVQKDAERNVRSRIETANVTAQEPQPPQHPDLEWSATAKVNIQKPSSKGKGIGQMLFEMYNQSRLKGLIKWNDADLPPNYSEPANARHALELCQFVLTKDEFDAFRLQTMKSEKEVKELADKIEARSFRKMWELEGKDVNEAEEINKKRGSRASQPTYGAVGVRVRDYKAVCIEGNIDPFPVRGSGKTLAITSYFKTKTG